MPRLFEVVGKALEPEPRYLGHQFLAVAEMPVRRRGAHPGQACGLGDGEAGWPLFANQAQRALNERLPQIAMMIATPPGPAMLPAHVRKIYMPPPFSAALILGLRVSV